MEDARLILTLRNQGISDERVLTAMTALSRADFVPPGLRRESWRDAPLPIGGGQTISQPFVVARMTEALELRGRERVLEIGTGSGYQTAVLLILGAEVFTMELRPELAAAAAQHLAAWEGPRLHQAVANGFDGWPDAAPFDAIVLTAAPERIPAALLDQLAAGGRLVAPVGPADAGQELFRVRRDGAGRLHEERLLSVRFVPMLQEAPAPLH